ncbi:MAG: fused MFS/spermidine synthase [Burkholderiales bacterium]|nr:fused MFS/spermidine synthase [Burkholderiales bacterium]
MLRVYAVTVFLSAFLLFLVQPLIAKQILPWFGGSAAVWATCLVFFQSTLLAGYAYADSLVRWVSAGAMRWLHTALLAASLAVLPIVPAAAWKPAGEEPPTLLILGLLAATVGLPYFLLAATSPLAQAWFARGFPAGAPYRLFAISNLAAVLALLAYPFVIEPWLPVRAQTLAWSAGYVLFALLCAALARHGTRAPPPDAPPAAPGPTPTWSTRAEWLVHAAIGSAMLVAVTNHLSQNVASVPFLWVAPLSLYLLSFVLCFDTRGWYRRELFLALLAALVVGMALLLDSLQLHIVAPVFLAGLFVACMFVHGELAALRPDPSHLTGYYLVVSLGGALGGALVGIVAPLALVGHFEAGLGVVACATLALARTLRPPRAYAALYAVALPVAVWGSHVQMDGFTRGAIYASRNFFGAITVRDFGGITPWRSLRHGAILHGGQYLDPESRMGEPSTYYSRRSGVGLALAAFERPGRRIGIVGLGVGTIAAYGRPGDLMRFYELDPEVVAVARDYFTFLRDTPADVEIVVGDARLSLEREPPQSFDLLAIDAFAGDAIPAHLLTSEALGIYLRHLGPDGLLLIHATNRYLDLPPVIARLAAEKGLQAVLVSDAGAADDDPRASRSDWVAIARSHAPLAALAQAPGARELAADSRAPLWTDDFNNLFRILK